MTFQKIGLLPVIGILFYTGAFSFVSRVFLGAGSDAQLNDADGNLLNQIFGIFIILSVLKNEIGEKLFQSFNLKALIPFFIFLLFTIFSVAWSVEPEITVRRIIAVLPVIFLSYHLSKYYPIDVTYKLIGWIVSIVALFGLSLAVVWTDVAFLSGGLRDGAFIGLLTDKNGGARVYMIGIVLLIPSALNKCRISILAILICMLCLSLTKSASGVFLLLIAIATMVHFYIFSGKYGKKSNQQMIFFGIFCYFVIGYLLNILYEYLVMLAGRDPTLTDRTVIWDTILPLVYDRLYLGYGFGAFWVSIGADEFVERWGYIGNAHNGYIEAALNGGVISLILLLFVFAGSIYFLIKYLVLGFNKMYASMTLALFLTLIYSNFIAYTIPNYRSFDFFIFCLIIFCVANKNSYSKVEK